MGTARAVVAESTSCPACSARVSNPYSRSLIFWSAVSVILFLLTIEERPDGRPEFVPVLQERVVPAQSVDLCVARLRPGPPRPLCRLPYLVRGEEPVARDPDEEYLGLDPRVGFLV